MDNLKDVVKPLYTDCFTVNDHTDVAAVMNQLLADDFQSLGSVDSKGKQELIRQIQFFWQLVPDLKWEPQEMIQEGNTVVVRSIASGTPKGNFFGLEADGSKLFKIMTIDIHTVEGNQIRQVHHLEDWGTAMKQLQG
jgi:predicted ester cyclase